MLSVVGLSVLAGASLAQPFNGSVSFIAPTEVLTGETFDVAVVGSITGNPPAGIVGFNLEFNFDGAFDSFSAVNSEGLFIFDTFPSPASEGDVDVSAGTLVFAGQSLGAENVVLFTFEVTAGSEIGVIDITAAPGTVDGGGTNPLAYGTPSGGILFPTDVDSLSFTGASINVVPAPAGSVVVAGLAGLAMRRRH